MTQSGKDRAGQGAERFRSAVAGHRFLTHAAGCEGVVPDRLNGSFSFEVPGFDFPGAKWTCEGDTTDERGNVASHVAFGPNYPDQRWHLFDTNGAHRAGFYAIDLLPQGEGFEGIYEVAGNIVPSFNVGLWSPDGTRGDGPAVGGEIVPSGVRAWPNGILTVNGACHNTTSGVQEFLTLRRFDVGRNELAQMSLTFKCVGLAGVVEDANDNRLVLAHALAADGFGTSDLLGYWFDSSGHPLTGWFSVGPGGGAGHTYTVRALIGGGAAVRIDGAWTYFIPSGKAESQTAPPFLAGNPATDFTLVRGATAYAVLPRTGDTTRMKLYSRGGDLCGTLTFPSGGLTTGADGSVIASSGPRGCTKTVWPALLR